MPDTDFPDAGPTAGGDAPAPFGAIDLTRTPLARKPFAPDPTDPSLDGGQVLCHVALGARPEDFHPALQPIAQGYGLMLQPGPKLGPGALGSADDMRAATPAPGEADGQSADDGASGAQGKIQESTLDEVAARIRQRDIDYLDRYYDAMAKYANRYKVDPALPLGLGIESGFGTAGTYTRTGDAFGMTGGNTRHMTTAASPEENVRKFFENFGSRIYGAGDDVDTFINALQARDTKGGRIPDVNPYNSRDPAGWEAMARRGIQQIQGDLPLYLPRRTSRPRKN
jgi:hypothetical protein